MGDDRCGARGTVTVRVADYWPPPWGTSAAAGQAYGFYVVRSAATEGGGEAW